MLAQPGGGERRRLGAERRRNRRTVRSTFRDGGWHRNGHSTLRGCATGSWRGVGLVLVPTTATGWLRVRHGGGRLPPFPGYMEIYNGDSGRGCAARHYSPEMDRRRRKSERVRRDTVDGSRRSRRDSGDRDEWAIRVGRQTGCTRRCRPGFVTSCRPRPESQLRRRPSISTPTTPTTWHGHSLSSATQTGVLVLRTEERGRIPQL